MHLHEYHFHFYWFNPISLSRLYGVESRKNQNEMKKDWSSVYAEQIPHVLPGEAQRENVSSHISEIQAEKDRKLTTQKGMVGKIAIPKIGLEAVIVPGVDDKSIKNAVGWMESSSMPDEEGNMVLAGHRSHTYGKFFNRLGEMVEGDTIIVQTYSGTHTYTISSIKIVEPTDLSVLEPTEGKNTLTLITCHPLNSNRYRLIIKADQEGL